MTSFNWFSLFSGPKQFFFRGHNYFFSGHVPELAGRKVDWLDGRNICREYCMDLVSLESQEENNMVFRLIQQSKFVESKVARKMRNVCTVWSKYLMASLFFKTFWLFVRDFRGTAFCCRLIIDRDKISC